MRTGRASLLCIGVASLLLLVSRAAGAETRLVAEPDRAVFDQLGGGSRSFRISSTILGESRRVVVHLPPSFARSPASRRFPTTVVLDGAMLLRPVVIASEVMVAEGQIPESVIVAIENTDDFEGRVRDFTPPGLSVSGSDLRQGGDRFLDFVEDELLPALETQFRAGSPRTIVGASSSGILVTWSAATRDTFRFHLALDAPTQQGDQFLGKRLLQRARAKSSPIRYASIEARFGWSDEAWNRLEAAAPPSWLLYRQRLEHESHNSMQFVGTYIGLRELFRDYAMFTVQDAPTTSILPAYERLTAPYGATMTPPEPLLMQVIEDLLMEGRGAEARAAFEALRSGYGEPDDAEGLRARIAEVERKPPPTETVEGLLGTPFPTPEEAKDYLGVWEGEKWVNPEIRNRFVLKLVAEGGKVTGTMTTWTDSHAEHVSVLQYLKITAAGLSFGEMNGMRPRGMILHEGTRDGQELSGSVRFGGINFDPPDGRGAPNIRFVLRKVTQ
ncbi:MAG: alpha/beta hydrolase-fold protein [Thermoanaerobaculia bacterium]|jgi:hypothetical protein